MVSKIQKVLPLTQMDGGGRQVHSALPYPLIGAMVGQVWGLWAGRDMNGPGIGDGRGEEANSRWC